MYTDLVLNAFGADLQDMVAAAQVADSGGFDGVWTFDHFSGIVVGAPWSRDPFVCLGAIAEATERVNLGVLVANMVNRHPAQLASAVSSLQSLAPGRVRCGIGAGAGPGSRFAAEQEAIGRELEPDETRRQQLCEAIEALRAMWPGNDTLDGGVAAVVDPSHTCPPIVVGAAGLTTIRMTAPLCDGVNIRAGAGLAEKVAEARRAAANNAVEVSVFDRLEESHPLGGDMAPYERLGIDRRTLLVDAPYNLERLQEIAVALSDVVDER